MGKYCRRGERFVIKLWRRTISQMDRATTQKKKKKNAPKKKISQCLQFPYVAEWACFLDLKIVIFLSSCFCFLKGFTFHLRNEKENIKERKAEMRHTHTHAQREKEKERGKERGDRKLLRQAFVWLKCYEQSNKTAH